MGGCGITVQDTGELSKGSSKQKGGLVMAGLVARIFFAPEAGAEMKSVQVVTALEGCGLKGDRYCSGTGRWSRFERDCEVTFVEAEHLECIGLETGMRVENGE